MDGQPTYRADLLSIPSIHGAMQALANAYILGTQLPMLGSCYAFIEFFSVGSCGTLDHGRTAFKFQLLFVFDIVIGHYNSFFDQCTVFLGEGT